MKYFVTGSVISTAFIISHAAELFFNSVAYTGHLLDRAGVYAFYGIPYARQPVGRFRFTRPEPMSSINEWQLTTEEKRNFYLTPKTSPKTCPQIDPFGSTMDPESIEDCLRIDLYMKREILDRSTTQTTGMAVLIEGFDFKHSIAHKVDVTSSFLSTSFSEPGVSVLAVVHYRLGAFGFLTTEDEDGPANLGLWDQHMALSFLKSQASSLKVDTNRISVLGFGSGGISTSIHMINNRNRGAFQSAVISGGSALSPDVNLPNTRDNAFEFGRMVDCSSGSSYKLIQCLRNADLTRIVSASADPNFMFGPIVDKNHTNDMTKVYIEDLPEKLLKQFNFNDIRGVIYGYAENSGSYRYFSSKNTKRLSDLNAKEKPLTVEAKIKSFLRPYQKYGDTTNTIAAAAKFLYFRNYTDETLLSNVTLFDELMSKAFTDYLSFSPIVTAARIHADKRASEQYTGVFIYERKAESTMPSFGDRLTAMRSATVKYATYMDDMLQFFNLQGVTSSNQNDQNLRSNWQNAFRGSLFGSAGQVSPNVAGLNEFNMRTGQITYITILQNSGVGQAVTQPYKLPARIFWSEFVPDIQETLDGISQKSIERLYSLKTQKIISIVTGVVGALFLVVGAVLGFLFLKSRAPRGTSPNVAFRKVPQNES